MPDRTSNRPAQVPRGLGWLAACGLVFCAVLAPQESRRARIVGVPAITVDAALEPPLRRQERVAPDHRHRDPPPAVAREGLDDLLAAIRLAHPTVVRDPEGHRLQLLVTVLPPDAAPPWQRHARGFRPDAEYFYPASAIKTFLAVAALRQLEALDRAHRVELDLDTPLALCVWNEPTCRLRRDPSNVEGGTITVRHELRKMMLVSSNIAFNRLFDFVGRDAAHGWARDVGLPTVRLFHRVTGGVPGGGTSPRVELHPTDGPPVVVPARQSQNAPAPGATLRMGVGRAHRAYFDARPDYPVAPGDLGRLVRTPADFRRKNAMGLVDLHRLLLAITRPKLVPEVELRLRKEHRAALLDAMGTDPLTSDNPPLRGPRHAEARFKPILRGVRSVVPRGWLRAVGKSGRAYGFEVDNIYLENERTGVAVAITAAVYVNPNGVVGDDGYAYPVSAGVMETIGREVAVAHLLDL